MSITTDGAIVINNSQSSRIRGQEHDDIRVTMNEDDVNEQFLSITYVNDDDCIDMSRAEAEALFLVLDTMLHPDEAIS